ncbi:hypothetical protein [Poseidonibacter sp.]|uniref:hypothetical protein n=1 Tax=Poseidonibacter sp. TaxID=2321188 RepID=UPI003C76CF55
MNIYIYGNNSFKKEIHETLEHANIKFKLGDSKIQDLSELEDLKNAIQKNPKDIYLIDDEKIIKNNLLTQKMKFLLPKDGIEQEFLFDNGIADMSVDSLSEIPDYILTQYEKSKESEMNIEDSIKDIVDEAYEFDEKIELDDELAELLSSSNDEEILNDNLIDDFEEDNLAKLEDNLNLDKLENLIENNDIDDFDEGLTPAELEKLMNFQSDQGLNNVSYDYDDKDLISDQIHSENKSKNNDLFEDLYSDKEEMNEIDNLIKGEKMSDDFPELNSINEEDILAALNGLDNNQTSVNSNISNTNNKVSKKIEQMEIEGSNVDEIAQLISKLLNNKTLEITVKIKD